MRLAAVIIKGHRLFEHCTTFNFGGEYFYDATFDSANKVFSITKKINSNYIESFFGKHIASVSAIVGENGSGKSSILKEIKFNEKTIFIYEYKHEILAVLNKYRLGPRLAEWRSLEFENNTVKISWDSLIATRQEGITIDYNISKAPDVVFFSSSNAIHEKSDNHLIEFSETNNIFKEAISQDDVEMIKIFRQLRLMENKDLLKNIKTVYPKFPSYDNLRYTTEDIHEKDIFDLEVKLYNFLLDTSKQVTEYDLLELYREKKYKFKLTQFSVSEESNKKKLSTKLRMAYKIIIAARAMAMIENSSFKNDLNINLDAEEADEHYYETYDNVINGLLSLKEDIKLATENKETESTKFIGEAISWLNKIPNDVLLDSKGVAEIINNGLLREQIFIQDKISSVLRDLLNLENLTLLKFVTTYNLSSGERHLLTLFADLYADEKLNVNKPNIILLDEPTVFLHPEWQKRFIKCLTLVIPEIVKSKIPKFEGESVSIPNVQVIFTTHDPLSLSDIPNNNITYLKNQDGFTKILNSELRPKKSFAANITDLLADSFFIQNGLIGDFARGKIKEIIDWLKDEKRDNNKSQYFKSIIQIIDEPIVKRKLSEMYDRIFNEDLEIQTIESQISELQRLKAKIKK